MSYGPINTISTVNQQVAIRNILELTFRRPKNFPHCEEVRRAEEALPAIVDPGEEVLKQQKYVPVSGVEVTRGLVLGIGLLGPMLAIPLMSDGQVTAGIVCGLVGGLFTTLAVRLIRKSSKEKDAVLKSEEDAALKTATEARQRWTEQVDQNKQRREAILKRVEPFLRK